MQPGDTYYWTLVLFFEVGLIESPLSLSCITEDLELNFRESASKLVSSFTMHDLMWWSGHESYYLSRVLALGCDLDQLVCLQRFG